MGVDLARELARHPRFRWAERMVTTCQLTILDGGDRDYVVGWRPGATRDNGGWYDGEAAGLVPALADAATQGCIARAYLAAVDELSRGPWTVAQRDKFHRRLGAAMCDADGITLAGMLLDAWGALDARGGGE